MANALDVRGTVRSIDLGDMVVWAVCADLRRHKAPG